MARPINIIVYPVKDLEKAKAFYAKFLGVDPYADSPYYVGFRIGELEVGLDPNSQAGPIGYIAVDDINSSLQELLAAGAETIQEPKDVGGGLLIAQVKDADSNVLGLRQQP